MELFGKASPDTGVETRPLAERMRPRRLEDFIGHRDIIGEGTLLSQAIARDRLFSIILWGPPGCGKTTLARLLASASRSHFVHFSAVLSGIKEIRAVIEAARDQLKVHQRATILFVDEIHRFNKAQQDAFLHHVESGLLTLIGATTENPSFEVIAPLLSRCRVLTLRPLTDADLGAILQRALRDSDQGLGKYQLVLSDQAADHLIALSHGDARTVLNNLEMASLLTMARQGPAADGTGREISLQDVEQAVLKKALQYDKTGEEHFNLISALHKSMRGSDPDAALYWLARMLMAGEDPLYIARRMVRFASEDIGNADPFALQIAMAAMEAFRFVGPPEGELALAQAAIYLSTAPKSNSIYTAYGRVQEVIKRTGTLPSPLHIRNAPTALMKDLGYGRGYQYAHDFKDAHVPQQYLPDRLKGDLYYFPQERGYEKQIKQRLSAWRAKGSRNK